MASSQQILDRAEQRCKDNNARLTTKRKQVLQGLLVSGKALSAYELADICKERFDANMPVMSVYRILEFLEQENLVHKLRLANKYIACSHIACDHQHGVPQFLICNECQNVKEITIEQDTINAIESSVVNANYQLVNPQLEINCICNQCSLTR
ncbi:MAG: transcriptional repressor [Kangiellaceae bacterium]|jgi:Fur family zinc uptake transcriptional regulator|nr:transcriptional repressor [Kangiellaceae bacterium]